MTRFTLLVFILLVSSCKGAWFQEDVYQDDARIPSRDDVIESTRRDLLLSVLISLDKIQNSISSSEESESDQSPSRLDYAVDTSNLRDSPEQVKTRPSKRGRYDLSGVLPPFNELCRAFHMGSCSYSRHK